ncbi:MAG: ferrous iron transporter B [Pirellulaceae bacterium]|nr:ferrous iron transporter B [Pirellulaceae bacterium]
MNSSSASVHRQDTISKQTKRIALVGNPNAGKTTLFNALTGLRAKTANYPGITVDVRRGTIKIGQTRVELIDLPGLYSLDSLTPEEEVASAVLSGTASNEPQPDAILLVVDSTNIERNLFLASEVLELAHPTVVALSLHDAATSAGISIDIDSLAERLNCPVVPVSSRTGEGLDQLRMLLTSLVGDLNDLTIQDQTSCTEGCSGCTFAARYDWAETIATQTVQTPETHGQLTERIDRWLTRPIVGVCAFLAVMLSVFYLIFSLADVPMTLIEEGFGQIAQLIDRILPTTPNVSLQRKAIIFSIAAAILGLALRLSRRRLNWLTGGSIAIGAGLVSLLSTEDFRSLIIDGIVGGVGGVLVFLPQICILFFFIALLEDSGYMARAAFVMERIMRFAGLPGKAFVPMLSAHACAIPGIMAARVIDNWRDRLVTILVLPLLTCSARLPVYGMVASLLFAESTAKAAAVFLGAYLLGLAAALLTAFCLKQTILRGETAPLVLELPPYRRPSFRNALTTVLDRSMIFIRRAGTIILLISVILWVLVTYPKLPTAVPASSSEINEPGQGMTRFANLSSEESEQQLAQQQLAYSWAGRIGQGVEPIFRPLGFDWKINVGVVSSFAAREVIVSTLAIIYGIGEDNAEDEDRLTETLREQKHSDGTPVYSQATCLSLLVFYVLAMQCLPTQVVTRRETGSWSWALFQFGYMTTLAYVAALATYQIAIRC